MAEKIVLTLNAENNRLSILQYYKEKSGNAKHAKKDLRRIRKSV